jgi:hypothetical protein
MDLNFEKTRELDKTVQIVFLTAGEDYYEDFRKQIYTEAGVVLYLFEN